MQKNLVAILVVICIILISVLVISSSANGVKLKKAQAQIAALNNTVLEKDAELLKLQNTLRDREQALERVNREMETVKTELSNTVLRLQASSVTQK